MKVLVGTLVAAIALCTVPAMAGDGGKFKAMSKVAGAKALSSHELSQVEGGDLVFGHTPVTIPSLTISNFLNEVLLTQLGVGGRSPVLVTTQVQTILTSLPGGGVNVSLQPHTFVLAKDLTCSGCIFP